MAHPSQRPHVSDWEPATVVGVKAYKLSHLKEAEPCHARQEKTGRCMEPWLHDMADPDLSSEEPEVLERMVPRFPTGVIQVRSKVVLCGLPFS